MAYGDFKDLNRRTADKVLRDKAFNIAENPEYNRYRRGLASMIYKYFDKKTSGDAALHLQFNSLFEKMKPFLIQKNSQKNYTNQLWGNL